MLSHTSFQYNYNTTIALQQIELDMNCDFSSNINIWAWFYEFSWRPFWFLFSYFRSNRLIGISCMSFLAAILMWNFWLQTSHFRPQISEVPTELLQF